MSEPDKWAPVSLREALEQSARDIAELPQSTREVFERNRELERGEGGEIERPASANSRARRTQTAHVSTQPCAVPKAIVSEGAVLRKSEQRITSADFRADPGKWLDASKHGPVVVLGDDGEESMTIVRPTPEESPADAYARGRREAYEAAVRVSHECEAEDWEEWARTPTQFRRLLRERVMEVRDDG